MALTPSELRAGSAAIIGADDSAFTFHGIGAASAPAVRAIPPAIMAARIAIAMFIDDPLTPQTPLSLNSLTSFGGRGGLSCIAPYLLILGSPPYPPILED